MRKERALKNIQGILLLVIALNAFGGGYYGMAGAENVPTEWLQGSAFTSYFLPSLFLFVVIGGMCLVGSIAAFRNSAYTWHLSLVCAILLAGWIIIQLLIIGYVSWMQPAVFICAIVIAAITFFARSQMFQSEKS